MALAQVSLKMTFEYFPVFPLACGEEILLKRLFDITQTNNSKVLAQPSTKCGKLTDIFVSNLSIWG